MKAGLSAIFFSLLLGFIALLNSCKNDNLPYTSEYITSLKVVATNLRTSAVDTFEYVNFNETRPNPPSYVDTVRLQANTAYAIQVLLLNEAPNPVVNMTDTIVSRAADHLMLYNVDPSPGLIAVKILDKDANGLPLGLQCNWTSSDSTNGWLRMILRQQPGNKNGTDMPGNTVFEADFPVTVR